MKVVRIIVLAVCVCFLLIGCGNRSKDTIIVGTKDFPEQYILGNILMLLIEEHTDINAIIKGNMASHVIFAAVGTGDIDVYVDYTGTIYSYYLRQSESKTAEEIHDFVTREMARQYDLRVLGLLGFNNTFCLAVRSEVAANYNLRTISDLAEVSSTMIFGGSTEILNRNDGIPGLKRAYNMSFKEERAIHDNERYQAILVGDIQVAEVFSTDGFIRELDLVVLEDDKNFFPPYNGVVVIRNEILEKHPELLGVLSMLEGVLTDEVMRNLNFRADVLEESPRHVAESFLREAGLIK